MRFIFLVFFVNLLSAADCKDTLFGEKQVYTLSTDPIDIVIPCAPKDLGTLELCIEGAKKNIENVRHIFVISKESLTQSAEWIPESLFPFSLSLIANEIYHGNQLAASTYARSSRNRLGWIMQQLLKFYAPLLIPDISPNVLILDSDVIVLLPMSVITENGSPLFTPANEYTHEYFEHAEKLLPGLHRVHAQYSGIAHHMLFQRPILQDFFDLIEQTHGVEPWKAICRCINRRSVYQSPLSEYELYFNFVLLRTNQGIIRPLQWANVCTLSECDTYRNRNYSYIAAHSWLRETKP